LIACKVYKIRELQQKYKDIEMNKPSKAAWLPLLLSVTLVIGMIAGSLLNKPDRGTQANQKIATILNLIQNEYVDNIDIDSLLEKTLPQLLANLDPHSCYISKADLQSVNEELDGSFSGIGIQFTINNDTITVIEAISGGPSEKVGIQAGDRIVSVDGKTVAGKSITSKEATSLLKGDKGTKVLLGIKRASSKKILEYEVTRGDIPVFTIDAAYLIDDTTAYVKVNRFGRNTYADFLSSLILLSKDGAKHYVIDLRGNTGGYMEMAILMANEFLPKGAIIVSKKGNNGKNDEVFLADGNGAFSTQGITVLLDEYSASSSEIFAGAIQDNDRGLIIGRRSFGKGLIQRQAELPDSSAIRLTIARYYTPSGRCIQRDYSDSQTYRDDIVQRYVHGELFTPDSVKQNTEQIYHTLTGRVVYGGGGIMPDIYIPVDTTGFTRYYVNVANAGLLNKFAFEYSDMNRAQLSQVEDIEPLLPGDQLLLRSFVNYAAQNGVPAQWYYINKSRDLILDQLKALIARDAAGIESYYRIMNRRDPVVKKALAEIQQGNNQSPIVPETQEEQQDGKGTAKAAD